MSGEYDVYQPCPCGSGKKAKFCCHAIIGEMVKVADLQASHQFQAALDLLETTEKKVQPREAWSRAWIKTTRAFILFSLGQTDEPRRLDDEVLAELPGHPMAAALNAVLALATEGYPAAMRPIYRAFQTATEQQPHASSFLALSLAQSLLSLGHPLAAVQHLIMAVMFDPEHQEAVEMFSALVSDGKIQYPLRDSYAFEPLVGRDDLEAPFQQALQLAAEGCFSDAAKAFGSVARQEPKNAGLWWNIALCHAFAGEDPLAVQALKAAAANEPDFETAVDDLLLSRLLRPPTPETRIARTTSRYRVESVSKLLTVLDHHPEYARIDLSEAGEQKPAGAYRILDRDPKLVADDDLSAANIAHIIGEVVIYSSPDGKAALAIVATHGAERLAKVNAAFAELAGPLAVADGEPTEMGYLRKEHERLILDWHFTPTLSGARRRVLKLEFCRQLAEEIWPGIPQELLGGKTPLEAAAVPELKTALAAAVLDLDVFCERNDLIVDQAAVRARLGLPPVERTLPRQETSPSISLLHLRHTALEKLSDEQLVTAANHVLRLGHGPLSQAVILEALGRATLKDKLDVPKLCMTVASICERRLDLQGALSWIIRGKEEARARKQPLDMLAVWEIQELIFRSRDPGDQQVAALANNLWNYYAAKLPEIRETVRDLLERLSIPGPWNAAPESVTAGAPLAGAGVSGAGLWTPEAEQPGQPSKLWLPGQQ